MTMSLQLLWNYWSIYHETWYVDRTSYGVMHIGRKFWSPHFCWSYAPWNLENIRKSTNNLSFLCQFFINEITASDAGPDIIRSHLFLKLFIWQFTTTNVFDIMLFVGFSCPPLDREKAIPDFLEWVKKHGVDSSAVELVSFPDCGYGLQATKDLKVRGILDLCIKATKPFPFILVYITWGFFS